MIPEVALYIVFCDLQFASLRLALALLNSLVTMGSPPNWIVKFLTNLRGYDRPASLGRRLNQNWSLQSDICSSLHIWLKEKWRRNWLKPRLHLWPFTIGTNAGDLNYRAEMKHKKMRIQSVPVGLLKAISTEPWRPKMYNTNHGWHLLTAQVKVANNLHREHYHHKQPVKASSQFSVWTASTCRHRGRYRTEPAILAVDRPGRKNLMVILRLRAAREGLCGHTEGSFELKAKAGQLLKTTLAMTLNGGGSSCI